MSSDNTTPTAAQCAVHPVFAQLPAVQAHFRRQAEQEAQEAERAAEECLSSEGRARYAAIAAEIRQGLS